MTVLDIAFDHCTDPIDAAYVMKNNWEVFKRRPYIVPTQFFIEKNFALTVPNALIEKIVSDTTKKCNLVLSNMPASLKTKWVFQGS